MNLFAIHFLNTRNPLNQKPGTFWGICYTSLPWRIKKSIPLYLLNHPPDTFWGVCNTPQNIRIKNSRKDPFSVHRCRGVLHTHHKCPWQWANESSTWYVSIKYVLIESFSQKGFDSPPPIESYTRQKLDSPLKPPTHNDPFFVYRCRGVWHTPHKYPWQWANDSFARYVSVKYVFVESFSQKG